MFPTVLPALSAIGRFMRNVMVFGSLMQELCQLLSGVVGHDYPTFGDELAYCALDKIVLSFTDDGRAQFAVRSKMSCVGQAWTP